MPKAAIWLGAGGLLRFVGLAAAIPFLAGDARGLAAHALAAYGATILSFLGGVQWGLAIGGEQEGAKDSLMARLTISIMPSLIAWAALLFPERSGLLILCSGIVAMLAVDLRATRLGQAPAWYPKLRVPLTCAVGATLLLAALA